ncbi:MAG: TraR/DksA C4-type zinc finger protein [Marmoricola sp.]
MDAGGPVISPRDLLAADRVETEDRLTRLRDDYSGVVAATRDANSDDEHDPEGHTIAYERSQTGALVRQAERHLAEIDAALLRVEQGTYGICESCGEEVPAERLEARPTARTCIACA